MEKTKRDSRHIDPLKDEEKFFQWLKFKSVRVNQEHLSKDDYERLRQRIHVSLRMLRRKRTVRRVAYYGVSVCVIIALGIVAYLNHYERVEPVPSVVEKKAEIVWQPLKSEDIRLVSGDSITSFRQNVQLLLSKDGSAMVYHPNSGQKRIRMEQDEVNELVVPYGKRSKVKLEDGTEIWLNSGSVFKFPTHFSGEKREVSLKGEMYAEVTADSKKPFIVHTAHFDIQVYGTRFNISAYEDEPTPSCVLVDGIVGFRPESGPEIRMKTNEKVLYDGKRFEKRKVSASRYTCWKEGYLELDDANIMDVLNRIGRYYNLSFSFGDKKRLTGRKCSGKIYLSDNIDNVLTTISLLYSTDYRKEERTIFISENP